MKFFFSLSLLFHVSLEAFTQPVKQYDWLMIYYIPYDNNLDEYTDSILYELEAGVGANTMIAVFIDRYNHLDSGLNDNYYGTKRILLSKNFKKELNDTNELSANTETFNSFLKWATQSCSFNKYAITLLDHGVGVDKLAADEYPYEKFLRIDSVAIVIEKNALAIGKKPELIFLQLCSRATAEFLYQLKDCSIYTLCSQTPITAPNAYYRNTMEALSIQQIITGEELARLITEKERPDMYNSYTLVNNSNFGKWAQLLNQFLKNIANRPILINHTTVERVYDSGFDFLDFNSLINSIQFAPFQETNQSKTELLRFTNDSLIVFHRISPASDKMTNFSGFSLTKQKSANFKKSYKHLNFYKECNISTLYLSILNSK